MSTIYQASTLSCGVHPKHRLLFSNFVWDINCLYGPQHLLVIVKEIISWKSITGVATGWNNLGLVLYGYGLRPHSGMSDQWDLNINLSIIIISYDRWE